MSVELSISFGVASSQSFSAHGQSSISTSLTNPEKAQHELKLSSKFSKVLGRTSNGISSPSSHQKRQWAKRIKTS
jgi:hypothetical protein